MNNESRILTPHAITIAAFGGVRATARVLGCDVGKVSRWGKTGLIPAKYQRRVLEAAWASGIDLTAHDVVFGRSL